MTTCAICETPITLTIEPHWTGWLDEDGDQLSYSPSLHDHVPGCEAWVGYFNEDGAVACGKPAVTVLRDGGASMPVCTEHDATARRLAQ